MRVAFFGEYGCPKGNWGLSKIIKPIFSMTYNSQDIFTLELPTVDCVKEMKYNKVCDDCPVNGKIKSNIIKMWKNHPMSSTVIET